MRKINKIVIHCSNSNFGNAALIDHWHRQRGWDRIGYHYVICNSWIEANSAHSINDGLLETGRPLTKTGAHVRGHNYDSIGICLIGKSGSFSISQWKTTIDLLFRLCQWYDNLSIFQHSDLNPGKPYCAGIFDSAFPLPFSKRILPSEQKTL